MKTSPYLRLERRIAADERGGILHRWSYGRQLRESRNGRQRLPKGMIGDLVAAAEKAGLKLSEREIQYRIQCAEAYETEAHSRSAAAAMGSWRALCDAGFPAVEFEVDPDELMAAGLASAPDEWDQMQLDIPGLKPVISVRGRKVAVVKGEDGATVADVAAYLDMCEQMHESFGKTVDQIRESLKTMREGSDGDDEANAVEAWEDGHEHDDQDDE